MRSALIELLAHELAPSEGRVQAVLRIAAACSITVTIAMVFQIPEPTYMAYIVFLISKDETSATLTTGVGAMLAVTLATVLNLGLLLVDTAAPALRLPAMALATFVGMYSVRTFALGPISYLAGFLVVLVQTLIDDIPSPEKLTRLALWEWVVVMVPIAQGGRRAGVPRCRTALPLSRHRRFGARLPERRLGQLRLQALLEREPARGNILFSFSVPLFDGGLRSSRISMARSQVREAEGKLDQTRDTAAQQVVKAYNGLVTSLAEYEAATELSRAAHTAYDAALRSYRQGVGTYTDVATEESAVAQAETQVEDARASAHTAAAALAFAMGTPESAQSPMR